MNVAVFIYWFLVAVLIYAYFGYAVIAWLFRSAPQSGINFPDQDLPAVTCIIPCYNEEEVIETKISNTKNLAYPASKLSVVIVNDGSTDNTEKIVQTFDDVVIINHPNRKGKAAALNSAMQVVKTDFVFFSDANALLNKDALRLMMRHFTNDKVGGVAGEKKVSHADNIGKAEGWYWQYESFLKSLDAAFYSVISATGEAFAVRTGLFTPLKEDVILDDFFLSMQICQQGFVIAYEPAAYATEQPSQDLTNEFHRKVRIAAGAFQSFEYISLRKLVCFPRLMFQVFSRRWLRWVACPVAIPLLFILNVFIVLKDNSYVYTVFLVVQILFYGMAAMGALFQKNKNYTLFALPFYFLFMNFCMLAGFWCFLNNQQTVLWKKAKRG